MKAKNILMSVLLAMGFIAAKADGNPPELILVSQPVLVYNYNSVTVTYDLQNIGDYSYKGDICIYLDPDDGTEYAYKRIKVCPGKIKRVSLDISAMRLNPSTVYTIMPYYEMDDDLYSFTTFEYFEPISFSWDGPRTATWIVTVLPPRPRFYTWPGDYRYYYDGFLPPPPPGPGPAPRPLPPPDPHHHTYHYHHDNGGYPGGHNPPPPGPNNGPNGGPGGGPDPNGDNHDGGHHDDGHHNGGNNGGASVRPNGDGGSMSHGNANGNNPAPNGNGSGSLSNGNEHKPNNSGSNSGRTGNNGNVSRPSGEGSSHTGTTPTNERSGSGNVSRPSGNRGAGAGGVRGGAGGRAGRGGGGRGRR